MPVVIWVKKEAREFNIVQKNYRVGKNFYQQKTRTGFIIHQPHKEAG